MIQRMLTVTGTVDIRDIVLAAALMGEEAAAPSQYAFGGLHREDLGLQTGDIHAWIAQAQWLDLRDPTLEKGVAVLKTPYRSANPKRDRPFYRTTPTHSILKHGYRINSQSLPDVSISIYAADGKLVRILNLGYQPVGIYHQRSRAAYWDGRNTHGEPVASGVYFYTLTAGKFTATRKMLIKK